MAQEFIVVYPPQLPLLEIPAGNDYIIGYSPGIAKMVRMSVNTLLSGRSVPIWEADGVYPEDFIVEWQLKFWKSLEDDNEGNIPSENAHWTEVSQDETVVSTTPEILLRTVTKAAHGFVAKNVLTLNGSGVFVKVSDPSTENRIGIVTEVVDTNTFKIALAGYVTGLSGLAAGSKYYAQSDGTISTTPSDMPVLLADSTSSGYLLTSGSGGGSHFVGLYASLAALQSAHATADPGDYGFVDTGMGSDATIYIWDDDDSDWVAGGSGVTPPWDTTTSGTVELSTQAEAEAIITGANAASTTGLSDLRAPSEIGLYHFIRKFVTLAWTWTLAQTFTVGPTVSDATASMAAFFNGSKKLVSSTVSDF